MFLKKVYFFTFSLGYQSFMLSLKSQISILDNFVIREESISPVLALMNKEVIDHSHNTSSSSIKEVNFSLNQSYFIKISNKSTKFFFQLQNSDSEIQKSTESKLNTSGTSIASTSNTLERKISLEEKRSVTNSKSSLNNSQQLNESGASSNSIDHSNNFVAHSLTNDDLMNEDPEARCIVM